MDNKVFKVRKATPVAYTKSIMEFKKILKEHGYSEKAITEILKWYQ